MNFPIISSIPLILLGIILGIIGSPLFWWILVLFPVALLVKMRKRINMGNIIGVIIFAFIGFPFMSTGMIIVFIYLFLAFFVLGALLGIKRNTQNNAAPYSLFSFIVSIFGTIWIANIMPNPVPVIPTSPTNITNTGSTTILSGSSVN